MSETSRKRNERLTPVLERNIEELARRRRAAKEQRSSSERLADAITVFTGSMAFVYIHLIIFGLWIVANVGWIGQLPRWDPSFVLLAMIASVEAIFLSTFVLISQNRMMCDADRRADLDLQISLLMEHELSRVADVVAKIAAHVGAPTDPAELEEVTHEVEPTTVMDKIEERSDE
jgi:uncharacterized membrane protein